jgi:O-antigen/teichoic acid export membrane protein
MENNIKIQINKLKTFDKQRKLWLALSAVILILSGIIIFDWNIIYHHKLEWMAVVTGLTLSIVWWYWTMKLAKELIAIKLSDRIILQEIIEDIRYIRKEILKTLPNRD